MAILWKLISSSAKLTQLEKLEPKRIKNKKLWIVYHNEVGDVAIKHGGSQFAT